MKEFDDGIEPDWDFMTCLGMSKSWLREMDTLLPLAKGSVHFSVWLVAHTVVVVQHGK